MVELIYRVDIFEWAEKGIPQEDSNMILIYINISLYTVEILFCVKSSKSSSWHKNTILKETNKKVQNELGPHSTLIFLYQRQWLPTSI